MTDRQAIEDDVTNRIMAALKSGTVPWSRPWNATGTMPTSASSGKPYRGINVWLLELESMVKDYDSPLWLTFKQAKAFGGSVRKGEKGTQVIFWKRFTVKDRESGEDKTIPLMRAYHVFNLGQCDDVTLPPRFVPETREPVAIPDAVAQVLEGYVDGPTLEYAAQSRAFYSPNVDSITLPLVDTFQDGNALAGVVFHELTHSTGHHSRLDRFGTNGSPQHFGSERYAREELVAEMGSQLLAANVGVDVSVERSAAYIASWLEALANDSRLIITAAQQAQKSTDRILGTTWDVAA